MKRIFAIVLATSLLIAAAPRGDVDRIQGTWVCPHGSGRETWTFRANRFTHIRDAHVAEVVVGSPGKQGRTPYNVPRYEASGTFRLVGTKVPRVIILVYDKPRLVASTETTYELSDDTFVFQEGWGFGRRVLRVFKRDRRKD